MSEVDLPRMRQLARQYADGELSEDEYMEELDVDYLLRKHKENDVDYIHLKTRGEGDDIYFEPFIDGERADVRIEDDGENGAWYTILDPAGGHVTLAPVHSSNINQEDDGEGADA